MMATLSVDQPNACNNAPDEAAVIVIVANTSKSLKPLRDGLLFRPIAVRQQRHSIDKSEVPAESE